VDEKGEQTATNDDPSGTATQALGRKVEHQQDTEPNVKLEDLENDG
jgi:hypothetical protein